MDGRDAGWKPGAKGFEKAGGQRVPTSSGLPLRTVYTGGRAATLNKTIYGVTPKQTATPRAISGGDVRHAGTRKTHVLGQRES